MPEGFGRKGEILIECPFCGKAKIRVFHKEGYFQARVSRISAGAKTTRHWVPDQYMVLEDCPHCGAKKKDIEAKLEGKDEKPKSREELIERLKKRGLPLVFEKKEK